MSKKIDITVDEIYIYIFIAINIAILIFIAFETIKAAWNQHLPVYITAYIFNLPKIFT